MPRQDVVHVKSGGLDDGDQAPGAHRYRTLPGRRVSASAPVLTAGFWRTRRAAAVAGIVFGVLLLTAMVMLRLAQGDTGYESLRSDRDGRAAIRVSLELVPFAGIAFLWFIGVIREQLGDVEDRLFSTVFLGSGLLFVALLFVGTVIGSSMLAMLDGPNANPDVWSYGRDTSQGLVTVYAMRMAAVFTLSVSTAALRASALPRWVSFAGYLVALFLLLGAGEQKWIQLLFPIWVLLLSVVILLTSPSEPKPPTVGAPERPDEDR